MSDESLGQWLSEKIAEKERKETYGRVSATARLREQTAQIGHKMEEWAEEFAVKVHVRNVNLANAAERAADKSMKRANEIWDRNVDGALQVEIRMRLVETACTKLSGLIDEKTCKRLRRKLSRTDPEWGSEKTWRLTGPRISVLSTLKKRGWKELQNAQPWAARKAAETMEKEEIEAGEKKWTRKWIAASGIKEDVVQAQTAAVVEQWPWPGIEPPFAAIGCWVEAGKQPQNEAQWAATMQGEDEARKGRMTVHDLRKRARGLSEQIDQTIREAAKSVIDDMVGDAETVLKRIEKQWPWKKRAHRHKNRLCAVWAKTQEDEWKQVLAWEIEITNAPRAIASARDIDNIDEEVRSTHAVKIDARNPDEMVILGWKPRENVDEDTARHLANWQCRT